MHATKNPQLDHLDFYGGASERHLTQVYQKSFLSVYGARILFTRVGESILQAD